MNDILYRIQSMQTLVLSPASSTLTLYPQSSVLLVVAEGQGYFKMSERSDDLSYGSLLMAHPGDELELYSRDSLGIKIDQIQFDQYRMTEDRRERLSYCLDREGLPDSGMIADSCTPRIISLFRELMEGHRLPSSDKDSIKDQRMLLELLQEVFALARTLPHEQDIDPMRKLLSYIHSNYDSALPRPRLAELTGYHPHSLSKMFKKETGTSLSDYILQLRMDKAKEKLLTTSSPIHEIAAQTGYSDALYFSRKFKQSTGLYPTEFRSKPKRIVAFDYVGTLLALGIKPVGVERRMLRYSSLLEKELAGIPDFAPWDLESIRSLLPDIIVAPDYLEAEHLRQLRTIAPLIVQSCESADPPEIARVLGERLGRQREAESWLADLQGWIRRLSRKLRRTWPQEESIAVYEISDGKIYVMDLFDRCGYAVYECFGLSAPAKVRQEVLDKRRFKQIGPQQLGEYAADHMILSIYDKSGPEETARLLESEEWRSLPAVRGGRVYEIPMQQCWYNDGLALQRLLLVTTRMLTARGTRTTIVHQGWRSVSMDA